MLLNVCLIPCYMGVCFLSDVHFWAVHRLMHPWGWSVPLVGDVGGLLYRHVHYLHHLRYNPGPWAGLSMHPAEQLIYFSRSLWMLLLPCHPVVYLFSNLRAMIGPAPGHHGFEDWSGSRFHLVHHHVRGNPSPFYLFIPFFLVCAISVNVSPSADDIDVIDSYLILLFHFYCLIITMSLILSVDNYRFYRYFHATTARARTLTAILARLRMWSPEENQK